MVEFRGVKLGIMSILRIVKTPNPILRQPTSPVGQIDKKTLRLIRDMADTLAAQKDPQGVGLAAPQVGYSLRLFLIKPATKSPISVFINPIEIPNDQPESLKIEAEAEIKKEKRKLGLLEGCLSLPNYYSDVARRPAITVRFTTLDLKKAKRVGLENIQTEEVTKTLTGFPAQVVQHEMDHLNGRLFVDLVLEQKKRLLKLKGEEWEEVELGKV